MSSGGVLRGRYRDGLHIGIGTDPHHDVQAHKNPGYCRALLAADARFSSPTNLVDEFLQPLLRGFPPSKHLKWRGCSGQLSRLSNPLDYRFALQGWQIFCRL